MVHHRRARLAEDERRHAGHAQTLTDASARLRAAASTTNV
jgi:hypothetical protein